jgi:hypothetical protein
MYEGYLAMAGVELVNNERAAVYARALGITTIDCAPCSIGAAIDDPAYTTPQTDDAPWWDPAAPESAGFAGFFGLQVKGFDSSPIIRTPVERLGDGAVITRTRYAHREVVYTGVAMAVDQCSLSYGLAWLSTALRGSTCKPCGGVDACAYTCCPTVANENYTLRTMSQVGVLEGPITNRVSALKRACGGSAAPVIAEVTFTLILGRPWLYRAPVQVVNGPVFGAGCDAKSCVVWSGAPDPDPDACVVWEDENCDCVIWETPDHPGPDCPNGQDNAVDRQGCAKPGAHSCALDPQRLTNCPEPPSPPQPPRPYDPCGICYDGPNTVTGAVTVPPHTTPQWMDSVPLVQIRTGLEPARAILLRFYANPTGATCDPASLDPCNACATMAIPYVPAGATLTIDGRDYTAALDCDGGRGTAVIDDTAGIFGPDGRAYSWPVFDCTGFCITITVPCDFPTDVDIDVSVVAREDAA